MNNQIFCYKEKGIYNWFIAVWWQRKTALTICLYLWSHATETVAQAFAEQHWSIGMRSQQRWIISKQKKNKKKWTYWAFFSNRNNFLFTSMIIKPLEQMTNTPAHSNIISPQSTKIGSNDSQWVIWYIYFLVIWFFFKIFISQTQWTKWLPTSHLDISIFLCCF